VLIDSKPDTERSVPKREKQGASQRWHAVAIIGSRTACAAAQACKGKRYLSGEAPQLPLAKCDAARCECKYRHFEDRRAAERRRDLAPPVRDSANRRSSKGRRATD
jgi:hypothetical protein